MIQTISDELIASLIERARRSPRRRINHNFHHDAADNPHRFLNVLLRGTYIAPHRHLLPPKSETFLVLRGSAGVLTFHDDSRIQNRYLLGEPASDAPAFAGLTPQIGIDLAPGVWHTVAALSDAAVCFEVKPGPWDPQSDKEFAPWAPREGEPGTDAYLAALLAA